MPLPRDINEYLRAWALELGDRILQTYPPLQGFDDAASPLTGQLLRKPFPAQTLAMMGVVKRWTEARGAAVIAECGTGKTLISLGAVHVHSDRKPFTALAMVPPQLVEKWAREAFQSLPRVRVFFIDGLRTSTSCVGPVGISEVRLRGGHIIREGLRTTLTELRQRKMARTPRHRWDSICHPKLVQTGLDLIEFPTIVFYETGYSIYVLRQASRRSWRIGQHLPVKVKYLHYEETMQESCLRLMGKKLLVSLAMEGKFSSEGLQAINDEDDILMAMARELVTDKGVGERADAVWATLQKKQEDMLSARAKDEQMVAEIPLVEASSPQGDHCAALKSPVESPNQRNCPPSNSSVPGEQLTLF